MPTLTVRDIVVLSFMAEGPTYGYAIEAELQRRQVRDWVDCSRPQIYKSLEKLQRLRYARKVRNTTRARGPQAATIRIEQAGSTALRQRLIDDDWHTSRDHPLFATWLALCSTLSVQEITAGIDARERYVREQLARERRTAHDIAQDVTVTTPFPAAMVRLAILQFEVELAWLASVQNDLMGIGVTATTGLC